MSEFVSQCLQCSNFRNLYDNGRHTCRAFKKDIPDLIFYNDFIHNKPFPGDGGIRFQELKPEIGIPDELVEQRDELKSILPDLKKEPKYFAAVDHTAVFPDADTYAAFNNSRVYAGKNLTGNIKVGVPVLRKPIAVFRDFLEKTNTNETTIIEEYVGLFRQINGTVKSVYLLVNRNFLIEIRVLEESEESDFLNQISGTQIYKTY